MLTLFFVLIMSVWGICIAIIANSKGLNPIYWFLYGFFLSIISLVHVLVKLPTKEEIEFRHYDLGKDKCHVCAEWINKEAKICRYCQTELPANWANVNTD